MKNNLNKSVKNSSMTSTILQKQSWTNNKDKVRLSYTDSKGLKKVLMKMLVFDDNNKHSKNNNISNESIADFLTNSSNATNMSLLKFLAINALELSAPASTVLLQQRNTITPGWFQLAGHSESIAPAANGIVRKHITGPTDSEVIAYRGICKDTYASKIVPKFLGVTEINGESYIELEDLLRGFKDPNVIDIKMGYRTFLESEVSSEILRPDLYKKMISVDPNAPTDDEHKLKAITKLRYMLFREQLSSSQTKGFRIEALKVKGFQPMTDLKTVRTDSEIQATINHFINGKKNIAKEIIKCIKEMRTLIEKSEFFQTHEVVGSSIFIVYDHQQIGAWLIDFAKCRSLPEGVKINHRTKWIPGNSEEGLLHGFDELINTFDSVYQTQTKS